MKIFKRSIKVTNYKIYLGVLEIRPTALFCNVCVVAQIMRVVPKNSHINFHSCPGGGSSPPSQLICLFFGAPNMFKYTVKKVNLFLPVTCPLPNNWTDLHFYGHKKIKNKKLKLLSDPWSVRWSWQEKYSKGRYGNLLLIYYSSGPVGSRLGSRHR